MAKCIKCDQLVGGDFDCICNVCSSDQVKAVEDRATVLTTAVVSKHSQVVEYQKTIRKAIELLEEHDCRYEDASAEEAAEMLRALLPEEDTPEEHVRKVTKCL